MRKFLVLIPLLVLFLAACSSAYKKDQETVRRQQNIYNKAQPIPEFDYSIDRDILIQIYTLKNESFTTWSIVTSQGTGTILFFCPSIGYGIPADTQLTNPLGQLGEGSDLIVEQPEPNGLYSSDNTDATYVLCVLDSGKIAPVYTEQKVTVFPFEIQIVDGMIIPVGDTSISVELPK